jgi:hypothetical protein
MMIIFSIFALFTAFCTLSLSAGSGQDDERNPKTSLLSRRGRILSALPCVAQDEENSLLSPTKAPSAGRSPLSPLYLPAQNTDLQRLFFSKKPPSPAKQGKRFSQEVPSKFSSNGLTSGPFHEPKKKAKALLWAPKKEDLDQWYRDQIAFQNRYPHEDSGPSGLSHMMGRTYDSSAPPRDSDPYWREFP